MIKTCKKLFIILLFLLIAVMTTQKSYADYLADSYINNPDSAGGMITFNDLESRWDLLCRQRGTHIPSENNVSHAYTTSSGTGYIDGEGERDATGWIEAGKMVPGTTQQFDERHKDLVGSYETETKANYTIRGLLPCTPKAAYILNEAKSNTGTYYSQIQQAWWMTKEGGEGSNQGDNPLSKTASEYQNFVKRIAKNPNDVENIDTYKTMTHTYNDGTTASIQFPEIDVSKLVSRDTSKEVTVKYNKETQQYLIGPISLTYEQSTSNNVTFGTINNFKIYTDASDEAISNDKWEFVRAKKEEYRKNKDFPDSGEEFHIRINYIKGATKITSIDVDYQYLIAGANYQPLDGTYNKYTWQITENSKKVSDGKGGQKTVWEYRLQAKNQGLALEAQKLTLVKNAARWYETEEINLLNEKEEGYLKITKKAIDENGKELSTDQVKKEFGKHQYFDFKIKIIHSNGEIENDVVTVRAGSSVMAGPYSWEGEDEAPTFEVEEIPLPEDSDWKLISIEPQKGKLESSKTIEVTAINQITKKYHDKIEISKTISGPADEDEIFKFSVVVTMPNGQKDTDTATIVVPKGKTTGNVWLSKEYTWVGDKNPTYEISEIETEHSKKYTPSITPNKGELDGSGAKVKVNALNNIPTPEDAMSYLSFKKVLGEGQVTEDTFDFKVTVDGVKNTDSGKLEFEVLGVKADSTVGPYGFVWKDLNVAPTYTVEEINIDPEEAKVSTIEETVNGTSRVEKNTNKITGTLVKGETTNLTEVKFTNNMTKHSGGIKIIKDIETSEKISKETLEAEGTKFEIEVVIAGTFVHEGETYQNSTKVITKSLPDNGNWDFEVKDVVWYGSKAPTFTVTEKNLPTGWRLKTIQYSDLENESTDSEGHSLIENKTVEATLINELPSKMEWDLTFSMAGIVWVDETLDGKNTADDGYYSAPNGVYDEGETLKENAEVTVYRVVYDASGNEVERTVAEAYKDANKNELVFPIITKSDGKWEVPRIGVPALSDEEKENGYAVSYDVEFVYDGQTYEPTEFLSYKISSSGEKIRNEGDIPTRANEYRNADTVDKDKYARDSMAIAVQSDDQKVIAEVSGKTEIDSNGDTTGMAKFTDGTEAEITYSSANAGAGYPTISRVNTTDSEGKVLDIFKAAASTASGNLTFPFDVKDYDGTALTNIDTYVDEYGAHHKYSFMAVYNYCLNINLGLVERPSMDIGLTKKLDTAKVIVNEKLYQYNYSGNYDLTEEKVDSLDKDICVSNADATDPKTLNLYRSDYYYRAEMYENNSEIDGALTRFYKSLGKDKTDMEMAIYLSYKIKVENSSSKYDVKINSIDDYYDSSFSLVKQDETKYLKTQTIGGQKEDINDEIKVANASDYSDKWTDTKTGIVGSDKDGNGNNIVYNKMTASDLGIVLAPGESKEIKVTFKVNKKDTDEAKDAIILGQKCNVAEVASYSTYFTGTQNYAGKIDRDSAPSNVNLPAYNVKAWYEDDTFAAPRLKVNLVEVDRQIAGLAWEDNSKDKNIENPDYNQYVGDGIKQDDEKTIKGLKTELVEKVMVPNEDGTYTEYDYTWPTNKELEALNGNTIEILTGFNSTTETSNGGQYAFNSAPAGDYIVRFTYGDKKIEAANYSTAEYYNGQDFKSTQYKAFIEGRTGSKYVEPSKYLDIAATNASEEHRNSAVDSEVRRLEVVANSREITYDNNKILASSMSDEYLNGLGYTDEQINEFRSELLKGEEGKYYMFADTPKLDMNIEPSAFKGQDSNEGYHYEVKNVDFGLEERPSTQLTLDKQIEEIILTTSDGNTIMDAKYNINYNVADDGKITANVELDTANSYGTDNLQSLNRDQATTQGFRYISVDSKILEGTTITVKYRFTVLNTGEVDRTGKLAEMAYKEDVAAIKTVCDELSTELATYKKEGNSLKNDTILGEYVGSIYYYGGSGDSNDAVVSSTVRQLVDYIDNDATFSAVLNATANTSWSNVTASELKSMVAPDIISSQNNEDVILDSKEIRYETENRNNLIVSVDSTESTLNNKDFIVDLKPVEAEQGNYMASMNLTITRYVGSDSDDLQIDNVAEIIKYNNKVGRRDELTIAGNQVPALALEKHVDLTTPPTVSSGMQYERDTSATEVITLSPPFGSELSTWKLQVIGSITAGLAVVAGGIVLIKKKVLK